MSAVFSAPLSFFLLWLYRRAVLRGMNLRRRPAACSFRRPAPPSQPLRFTTLSKMSRSLATGDNGRLDQAVAKSLWGRALAYAAARLVFAMLITGQVYVLTPSGTLLGFLLAYILWSWPSFSACPVVGTGMARPVGLRGDYWVVYVLVGIFHRRLEVLTFEMVEGWLVHKRSTNPHVGCFLTRRVRAVGPLVLAFMVTAVAGAFLIGGLA